MTKRLKKFRLSWQVCSVLAPLLLLGSNSLLSADQTKTYRHGTMEFQYPTDWRLEERPGPRAFSVVIVPPDASAQFYIGTRDVPLGTDGAVQHEEELRAMMNVNSTWTRTKGPVADNHVRGRTAYESVLRKTDQPVSQFVYTIVKGGKLVVIVYAFQRDTSIDPHVFTVVADSLTF